MKPFRFVGLAAFFCLLIALSSCEKLQNDRSKTAAIDHNIAQSTLHDIFLQAYYHAKLTEGKTLDVLDCRTIVQNDSTYPKTVILDYGTENCEDRYNTERKGQLEMTISGAFDIAGETIKVVPQDFHVNNYKVEGTVEITYLETNENLNPMYTLSATELILTIDEDNSFSWRPERTYELIEGQQDLNFVWDDVFDVTGTASGTDREGLAYSTEVSSDFLTYSLVCRWPSQGQESLESDEVKDKTIDYGDNNNCSNKVTIERGNRSNTLDLR